MNHVRLIELGLKRSGVSLRYPFDPDLPVLYVGSKMFALFGRTAEHESVNLKADPEEIWLLRQQYAGSVLPGYHMNKKHWNTVVLDGKVPDKEVLAMLEQSYLLVRSKLTKREREELGES
ncbi:MmcQ/YjbR family DNA-binding protein [Cohnella terricola]|uniref:MmcQ/YjbR family DNA-binding protein n=1 Tax=Cohnella terricola TaxID=1289167 RepID=A0A559JB00_9BACL|nr:MmcQ/YjbR family DNA-binding protein [Cohnella terricola]TVX97055.1 MmcQ/YjbR family DNA-binding protein [Cohnella terricola]